MPFHPLERLWDRYASEAGNPIAQFNTLMYIGELALKILVLGVIAGVDDDADRHRYGLLHAVVRADGLGPWVRALDDALTGPAAQSLTPTVQDAELRELTSLGGIGTWQHETAENMHRVLSPLGVLSEPLPRQVDGRYSLRLFKELRNKARAHGIVTQDYCEVAGPPLDTAIRSIVANCTGFSRPWAYLHRNLSGKYRVAILAGSPERFIALKTEAGSAGVSLEDGVYVYLDGYRRVELACSDPQLDDFLIANGHFTGNTFELLSYATGERAVGDGSHFLVPAEQLPASDTEGRGDLDVRGESFSNLPAVPRGYVHRTVLEAELLQSLSDNSRHPIVTLVGRGGIGKTSTALAVLEDICQAGIYDAVLWFSARDIDLLGDGPKPVRRQVLGQKDIANLFVALMNPADRSSKGFKSTDYLAASLGSSPTGKPMLLVFDNFETVRNPAELYQWLDGFIRNPNKVLITTRHREFKADYPVDVGGMEFAEFSQLVGETAAELKITRLITAELVENLFSESDGHPYVAKVFLGEMARKGEPLSPRHLMRGKEDILEALFERSYALLSPAARRIFLTLSNWRSAVPLLALEGVIVSSAPQRIDVRKAVDELERSSFVTITPCEDPSGEAFVSVPLVAGVFGERKLQVDSAKAQVEVDTKYLQMLGAATVRDAARGIEPRISRLFGNVAENVKSGNATLEDSVPVLEYIASRYPEAWRMLADLYLELGGNTNADLAKSALRRYLESDLPEAAAYKAWRALARLAWQTNDHDTEFAAWLRIVEFPELTLIDASIGANSMNRLLQGTQVVADPEVKRTAAQKVAHAMEDLLTTSTPTADDYSRLAWLFLYRGEPDKARKYVDAGLAIEPDNTYCLNLKDKLTH